MRSLLFLAIFVVASIVAGFWVIHNPWLLIPAGLICTTAVAFLSLTWRQDRD